MGVWVPPVSSDSVAGHSLTPALAASAQSSRGYQNIDKETAHSHPAFLPVPQVRLGHLQPALAAWGQREEASPPLTSTLPG